MPDVRNPYRRYWMDQYYYTQQQLIQQAQVQEVLARQHQEQKKYGALRPNYNRLPPALRGGRRYRNDTLEVLTGGPFTEEEIRRLQQATEQERKELLYDAERELVKWRQQKQQEAAFNYSQQEIARWQQYSMRYGSTQKVINYEATKEAFKEWFSSLTPELKRVALAAGYQDVIKSLEAHTFTYKDYLKFAEMFKIFSGRLPEIKLEFSQLEQSPVLEAEPKHVTTKGIEGTAQEQALEWAVKQDPFTQLSNAAWEAEQAGGPVAGFLTGFTSSFLQGTAGVFSLSSIYGTYKLGQELASNPKDLALFLAGGPILYSGYKMGNLFPEYPGNLLGRLGGSVAAAIAWAKITQLQAQAAARNAKVVIEEFRMKEGRGYVSDNTLFMTGKGKWVKVSEWSLRDQYSYVAGGRGPGGVFLDYQKYIVPGGTKGYMTTGWPDTPVAANYIKFLRTSGLQGAAAKGPAGSYGVIDTGSTKAFFGFGSGGKLGGAKFTIGYKGPGALEAFWNVVTKRYPGAQVKIAGEELWVWSAKELEWHLTHSGQAAKAAGGLSYANAMQQLQSSGGAGGLLGSSILRYSVMPGAKTYPPAFVPTPPLLISGGRPGAVIEPPVKDLPKVITEEVTQQGMKGQGGKPGTVTIPTEVPGAGPTETTGPAEIPTNVPGQGKKHGALNINISIGSPTERWELVPKGPAGMPKPITIPKTKQNDDDSNKPKPPHKEPEPPFNIPKPVPRPPTNRPRTEVNTEVKVGAMPRLEIRLLPTQSKPLPEPPSRSLPKWIEGPKPPELDFKLPKLEGPRPRPRRRRLKVKYEERVNPFETIF